MLACLKEITKNVAVGLPADKAPAGKMQLKEFPGREGKLAVQLLAE